MKFFLDTNALIDFIMKRLLFQLFSKNRRIIRFFM